MAPFQTNPDTISQDMVTRVGSAAGLVARIQQDYAMQAESEPADDTRQVLADKARAAAERVIDEQGISIAGLQRGAPGGRSRRGSGTPAGRRGSGGALTCDVS